VRQTHLAPFSLGGPTHCTWEVGASALAIGDGKVDPNRFSHIYSAPHIQLQSFFHERATLLDYNSSVYRSYKSLAEYNINTSSAIYAQKLQVTLTTY